jgi:hypothetical protein
MDFNLYAYAHCVLHDGHDGAHGDGLGEPWIDITARDWQTMSATLSAIRAMHTVKRGEDDNGPYVICDYDKTPWPCRTQEMVAAGSWL